MIVVSYQVETIPISFDFVVTMAHRPLDNYESLIDFVTMVSTRVIVLTWQGMFIIDEIYRDDGTQLGNDLAGGAGLSHSILCADHQEPMLLSAPGSSTPLHNPKGPPW